MKLSAYQIDDFIKRIDTKTTKGVLIYGEDNGLINIRKQNILQRVLPNYKNNISLNLRTPEIFNNNPGIIYNEYNSSSLFSFDKKVILIEDFISQMLKSIQEIFEKN